MRNEFNTIDLFMGADGVTNTMDLYIVGTTPNTASIDLVMPSVLEPVNKTLPLYTHGFK